jgi:hypothetical protein
MLRSLKVIAVVIPVSLALVRAILWRSLAEDEMLINSVAPVIIGGIKAYQ